jgi:type III secretory pathway component EscV
MSIQPQAINEFVERKVKDGSCHSVAEAEKEIISHLISRDLEREIRIGEDQIENGEYDILDDDYIKNFIADAKKTVLSKYV